MTDTFSPIPELNLLKEFYDTQDDYLAPGFEMYDYGAEYDQDPPELAERLVYFAQANGSGSLYGFWRRDDREDVATQPVVAVGDEGGIHLVARDFREFLRLLASLPPDCEPDIDWNGFGVRALFDPEDDDYEPLDNKPFLTWLDRTCGITPADEWETVVDDAEAKLGREWGAWIHPIVPDAVWSPVHELNLLNRLNGATFGALANGFWLVEEYGEGTLAIEQNGERKRLGFPVLAADLEPFATNDSDTFFALWRLDGRADPASLPVVAVGKEADAHVVARDVPEFLTLVAGLTDTEIRCDGDGVGLRVCELADKRAEFLSWLEETCGLRPAADPAAVIETAQAELGERLVLALARD
ncbi:hypothetical protein [Nocardiopsis sp. NRRL B-16309]|uniref:hypothetical protein n=1 Tax=Nocardiopsis sp. NRRL B-16309 TaxID=1519494 RepID=UPI0006AE0829|nr:hypothetical protein [Nocardiopsis sp. NRRL B-16309]